MYKKILVPIEPGQIETADAALDLAEFLKSPDGEIILLSVVEEIPAYVAHQIPGDLIRNARKSTTEKLHELVSKRKLDVEIMVTHGHAAATIKAVQQQTSCDLIIISSHKPTTVDYVLGSTASKVVRRAQCPVFVTR